MSIFRQTARKIKPARHSARPPVPFGQGILPPARHRTFEPSPADRADAAQHFGERYGDWAARLIDRKAAREALARQIASVREKIESIDRAYAGGTVADHLRAAMMRERDGLVRRLDSLTIDLMA